MKSMFGLGVITQRGVQIIKNRTALFTISAVLQPISTLRNVTHAGILKIHPDGELAIEYQIGKGLTSGTVKSYANYGREVMTVDDLIERGGLISD